MKTPDEIKKGLERCKNGAHCDSCLNAHHCQVDADALALISQLEDEVSSRKAEAQVAKKWAQYFKRERDAAVNDVSLFPECHTCKYDPRKKGYIPNDCDDCVDHCNWQWRGVPLPEPPEEEE